MSCCEKLVLEPRDRGAGRLVDAPVGRRTVLRGVAGVAGGLALLPAGLGGGRARAQGAAVKLAFCGQLLCVVPYEVTQDAGFFRDEGLDVELVYTRGGNAAMQALVGGAVDYAGTSFDVALQAFAQGAPIQSFASTGRLPLFALAVGPGRVDEIRGLADLQGRTVGVSGLGNADHTLLLYLLQKAGADPASVEFAQLGPNLFDALRIGHVDAGMVQEPSLTLLEEAGGRTLVNFMDLDDAEQHLGGPYAFMSVSVRAAEREERLDEMRRLARALARGLEHLQAMPVAGIVDALPGELIAGGDRAQLESILERYRASLYPSTVAVDVAASERVAESQRVAGILGPEVALDALLDLDAVSG
ncbi:MAG TPA: ABC transporter substrate-binding protein [Geminicoccaceae bacterium]|nr:ABC transporter substrate-binding protein [Geminicoccaceae bacterium]